MALELVYTSAARGLRLGSSGFCTVACTRGMGPDYIETLESLSGYVPVFPPNHPQAGDNPVAFSHYRIAIGGKGAHILSRIAAAGIDYSKRANKFAYHLILDHTELLECGPAWTMRQPGLMLNQWEGEPRFLDRPKKIYAGKKEASACKKWEQYAGDAGWAGVLAQAFIDNPRQPSFIVFNPGMPMLELVTEALALVPARLRWDVTFNTYFTSLPAGTTCAWRCCLPDAPALKQARRIADAVILDLPRQAGQSSSMQERLRSGSILVECARTGAPPPRMPQLRPSSKSWRADAPLKLAEEGSVIARGAKQSKRRPKSPKSIWLKAMRPETQAEGERPGKTGVRLGIVLLAAMLCASLAGNVWLYLDKKRLSRSSKVDEKKISSLKEEVTKAEKKISSLKEELKKARTEKARLVGDKKKLAKNVSDLRQQVASLKKEPASPVEANNRPKVAILCHLGKLKDIQFGDNNNNEFPLNLPGIGGGAWKVIAVGWWETPESLTAELADGTLHLNGNRTGDSVCDVVYRNRALVFTSHHADSEQVAELKKIAWIELQNPDTKQKTVVFTRKRPREKIVYAKREKTRFSGSVRVEPVLAHWKENEWVLDMNEYGIKTRSISISDSGQLEFSVTFKPDKGKGKDRTPPKSDSGPGLSAQQKSAFDTPMKLRCGGETIAEFEFVREGR